MSIVKYSLQDVRGVPDDYEKNVRGTYNVGLPGSCYGPDYMFIFPEAMITQTHLSLSVNMEADYYVLKC